MNGDVVKVNLVDYNYAEYCAEAVCFTQTKCDLDKLHSNSIILISVFILFDCL